VRIPAAWVAGLCFVSSSVFANPTAPELQAQGEDLAKQGRFTEAIDSFKAADKLQPSAAHACLIALAYTRRELWPQAEIWLAQCQVRATAQDPLPEWAPAEQDQIKERLASANVAAVQIEVQPADAGANVTVSSFAPDEQFAPRTIHLPFGTHTIIAHAQGYKDESQTIEVKDKTAQHVVITLHKLGEGGAVVLPPARTASESNHTPWIVIGAGAGLGLVGAGLHLFWFKPARDALDTKDPVAYMTADKTQDFEHSRDVTIAVYAAAAITLGIGVYLKVSHKTSDDSPAVGVVPLPGGGMFSVGWSR
jgi:hypothetical protein